jgi:hypothetical protein
LLKEIPVKLNLRMLLILVGVACMFAVCSGTSTTLRAQQAAGSITGFVADDSGSAIPRAAVTVRDLERGTTWVAQTTDAGLYDFPTIPVGRVEVKVEAPGFAPEAHSPFELTLNQVARVDFHLKIGNVNQTVTVSGAPPLLQTGSTELGTLIDANAAANLPLATRDINQLTLLAPGVLTSNIFAFESPQTTFGTGRPYVNGAREQDNNFILDGMDVNQPDNDEVSYTPAPDAVQEFNIIVSNAAADYGNYAGGVIVESIKSGTNNFHGNLYEYVRNTDLEANTWQDKAVASIVGYGPASVIPRPGLHWNEFGGTVGGPLVKNKLFFFFDEENSIYDQPSTGNQNTVFYPGSGSSFYTPSGGFYNLGYYCTGFGGTFVNGICTGGGTQLYQPQVGEAATARQPFLNNMIPISSVDPVAAKLVALPAYQTQMTTVNYATAGYTHNYQGDFKLDFQPTANDHYMLRYTQMFTHVAQTNGIDLLTPNLERKYPLKNLTGDYVRTLSPSLVNDFRLGVQIFPANDEVFSPATSGNPNTEIGLQDVSVPILPSISTDFGTVGSSGGFEVFHDTTYQAEDSLTWTHGHHSIHSGFQYLHYDMNDIYAGNNGSAGAWTFNGQYTNNTGAVGGSGYADFLLGLPSLVDVGTPLHFNLANSLTAVFVQDNYQITHNLTLNLGMRYEVVTPRGDRDQSRNVNFDMITGAAKVGDNYDTYYGIGDYEPRFGFAWQPEFAPRTVIRGAYDISSFMEGNGIGNMNVINPPNTTQVYQNNVGSSPAIYPSGTLSDGYSPYQSPCTAADLIAATSNGTASPCITSQVTHATDQHLRPAMNQQWNLTIQHQFKNNFTASIGYVGDKDDHMADIFWYNQKVLTTGTQQVTDWPSGKLVTVPAVADGPYMQNLLKGGVSQARFNGSSAISRYEAMEATISQKSYHGLDMQANYTWSKCLSNSLGYFGAYGDEEGVGEQQNEGGGNFFQNEYNPKGDYGKCSIDAAGAFSGYALYNLPFGRGKQFANTVPKAVDEVIGGWNLAIDATFRSGFAVTPYDGYFFGSFNPAAASNLTAPSYVDRADCVAGQSPNEPMAFAQIGQSVGMTNLNPKYVTTQADGQFGNCGVGSLRGPHLKTSDLDLNKTFPISETTNITFMAQFMNLTNTPIFSIPNSWADTYSSCDGCNGTRLTGTNFSSPWSGSSTGTYGLLDGSNPGRQIEFAMKLNF